MSVPALLEFSGHFPVSKRAPFDRNSNYGNELSKRGAHTNTGTIRSPFPPPVITGGKTPMHHQFSSLAQMRSPPSFSSSVFETF